MEFIYGFFRVHLGCHVEFLFKISLGFLWVSPGVSLGTLGLHLGYRQERRKLKEMKSKETVKARSKESEEQEGEQ